MTKETILVLNTAYIDPKKKRLDIIKKIIQQGRWGKSTNAIWVIIDKNEFPWKDVLEMQDNIRWKFGSDFMTLFDICLDFSFERTSKLTLSNKTIIN